jgi:hypothetical protein
MYNQFCMLAYYGLAIACLLLGKYEYAVACIGAGAAYYAHVRIDQKG